MADIVRARGADEPVLLRHPRGDPALAASCSTACAGYLVYLPSAWPADPATTAGALNFGPDAPAACPVGDMADAGRRALGRAAAGGMSRTRSRPRPSRWPRRQPGQRRPSADSRARRATPPLALTMDWYRRQADGEDLRRPVPRRQIAAYEAPGPMSPPACRSARRRSSTPSWTSAPAPGQHLPDPTSSSRPGRAGAIRCTRWSATAACWCRWTRWCSPDDASSTTTTPTSRPTRQLGRARAALRRGRRPSGSAWARSLVVEVASNDGYLLQHFVAVGVPVLGIEPAANVAEAGRRQRACRPRCAFFGEETGGDLASAGCSADLIAANNVLAHVPDIDDFVAGFATVLKPEGVLTLRVPAPAEPDRAGRSSTPSTTSTSPTSRCWRWSRRWPRHGLTVVRRRTTAHPRRQPAAVCCHAGATGHAETEASRGPAGRGGARPASTGIETYAGFAPGSRVPCGTASGLPRRGQGDGPDGRAYGAAAKGNTFLNYCGVDHRRHRLRGRPQPGQAGPPAAGQPPARSWRPSASSRPGPTTW